jgi:hypothetical protein
MPSLHPGWRIIGLLLAFVFFGLATSGIVRGRFGDPETGLLERARNPMVFWLSVIGLVLMGLYLLAVALGLPFPWLAGPSSRGAVS